MPFEYWQSVSADSKRMPGSDRVHCIRILARLEPFALLARFWTERDHVLALPWSALVQVLPNEREQEAQQS